MIAEDVIKEKSLLECLKAFQGAETGASASEREKSLEPVFKMLARKFIYGGYLKVGNDYKVFLKTVEFYYHEEEGPVKDNYVYHRNGKFKSSFKDGHDRIVPYFPIMTLHSHWSGFDITFENPEKKYRASVLIREYAIFDEKEGKYVYWDTKKKEYNYILSDKPIKDNRSSYLIYYINGFTIQEGQMTRIEWVDMMPEVYGKVKETPRKGIIWRDPETKAEKDSREWAFCEM